MVVRLNTLTHHTTNTPFGNNRGRLVGDYIPPSPLTLSHTCEMCVNVWEIPKHSFSIPEHPHIHTNNPLNSTKHTKHTLSRGFLPFLYFITFLCYPMFSYVFPCSMGCSLKEPIETSLLKEMFHQRNTVSTPTVLTIP